ncbi:hypothetical protein CPLU01_08174 [Colletotrichum plurivorum]|uniref:Uncharacterized protein n=1 Tax=Colletotrichum plurivorum TaxID=2175906 RepID=A0A8H6NDX2_9PEZI|nr:hypothetical protein CPLU01_08174 [Colletotrichum plurivorum]
MLSLACIVESSLPLSAVHRDEMATEAARSGWSCWSLLFALTFLVGPVPCAVDGDWGSANHRAEAIWWGGSETTADCGGYREDCQLERGSEDEEATTGDEKWEGPQALGWSPFSVLQSSWLSG